MCFGGSRNSERVLPRWSARVGLDRPVCPSRASELLGSPASSPSSPQRTPGSGARARAAPRPSPRGPGGQAVPRSVLPSACPPVLTRPGPVGCGPGCGVCPSADPAQLPAPTSVPSVFWAGRRRPRAGEQAPCGREGCSCEFPGARKGAQPAFHPALLDGHGRGVSGPGVCLSSRAPSPQMVPVQNPGVALAPHPCAGQSVAGATGLGLVGHRVPERQVRTERVRPFPGSRVQTDTGWRPLRSPPAPPSPCRHVSPQG